MAISLIHNSTIAVLVSTFGVTVLLLVFSETLPKTVAWNRPEGVAFTFARHLAAVQWLFMPAIQVLQAVTMLFTRMVGISNPLPRDSEQEIRTLITVGAQSGEVDASEAVLLEKVFRFGDQRVTEIMTPRPEIVWVQEGTTLDQFLGIYRQRRHTRFPVYSGTIENVTGLISIKDVLSAIGDGSVTREESVTNLTRPAMFVPETKPVRDTFREMQDNGQGLVLTIDEFGGIAGLVTLEQLLEIIVGDVGEEGDDIKQSYIRMGDNLFRLDGRAGIAEINEELSLGLPQGEYVTVAGFILERLGRVPAEGDAVEYGNLTLTVNAMGRGPDQRR